MPLEHFGFMSILVRSAYLGARHWESLKALGAIGCCRLCYYVVLGRARFPNVTEMFIGSLFLTIPTVIISFGSVFSSR